MRFLLESVIAVSAMAALTHSFSLPAGFDMNEIKYVFYLHLFRGENVLKFGSTGFESEMQLILQGYLTVSYKHSKISPALIKSV